MDQAQNLPLPKRISLWLPMMAVALLGGALVVAVFVILAFQLLYLDRVYPGITIAGIDVGSKTRAGVAEAIAGLSHEKMRRPLTIHIENNQWTFTGQELGVRLDVDATTTAAFQLGRQGNLFRDMLTQLALLRAPQNVPPLIRYEADATGKILQQLAAVVDYPPQNAGVTIHPDGTVEMTPSRRGQRLHIGATQALIEPALLADAPAAPQVTAFVQQVLPPIDTADVAAVEQQARQFLNGPLYFTLTVDDTPARWSLAPDQLAPMLSVVETPDAQGKPQLSLHLDSTQLQPYLAALTGTINTTATNATLAFDEEANQLQILQPSRDGRVLDVPAAIQRVEAALTGGDRNIDLPVQIIEPAISSKKPEELGIIGLVSESTSYFKGSSAGRMKNIALSASKFDGVILQPDEVFSFNKFLGPITKEEGYDESLIIFGDRTTLDVGGGVCQVSTTAFRAAFFGGLPIVERWAHAYRVGWYETNSEVGLDATIYTPEVDLKFRNDTGHFLLIHTETDLEAATVTFKFFGAPTHREVIVGKPLIENITSPPPPAYEMVDTLPPGQKKQIDWASDGMDVTITRTVKIDDTVLYKDRIISEYHPWQAVYQVGQTQ